MASLAIPGIVRLSGSKDDVKGLEGSLGAAMNAGAKRFILQFSTIRDMQALSKELAISGSPVFYQNLDFEGEARKAMGIYEPRMQQEDSRECRSSV